MILKVVLCSSTLIKIFKNVMLGGVLYKVLSSVLNFRAILILKSNRKISIQCYSTVVDEITNIIS